MSLFSLVQEAVKKEVKSRAGEVRTKLAEQVDRALQRVEESELYKKHVDFNQHEFFHLPAEEEEVEEEEEEYGEEMPIEPVANLQVSHLACAKLFDDVSKERMVYLELQVEDLVEQTDVIPCQAREWGESAVFNFPLVDVKTSLRIKCFERRNPIQHGDVLLGQVLIPVETLLLAQGGLSHETYELFPLESDWLEYKPRTLRRPSRVLGYLRVKLDFQVFTAKRLGVLGVYCNSRAYEPRARRAKVPAMSQSLETAQTIKALVQLQARIARLGQKIVLGPFAPTLCFAKARERPTNPASLVIITATCLAILYCPGYLLPWYVLGMVLLGAALTERNSTAAAAVPVWNEREANNELNPLQQISLLVWLAKQAVRVLTALADGSERAINALEFRDVNASLPLVAGGGCVLALLSSAFLYLLPLRYLLCAIYLAWTLSNVDFEAKLVAIKRSLVRRRRGGGAVIAAARPRTLPWTAIENLVDKVPTSDHLAHLYICEQQIVRDSELVRELFE